MLPSSKMLPSVAEVNPETVSSKVVFPAPFGPIRPSTSPGCRVKLTWSSASTPPKRTVSSRTSISTGTGRFGSPVFAADEAR